MNITGRKLFLKALKAEKVDTVFAYPGGMVTDLIDELGQQDEIRVILGRHEQALIHEAEGYARATGKPGVVLVTSGPGATNTITGIADAHYDSVPLVIFTGQVPQALIGNDAFQEVDIVGMTRSITKYSVTVRNRDELGKTIKMGFQIANSCKPGPVVIDIPKDIQTMSGDAEYPEKVVIRGYNPSEGVHIGQLKKAYKLLSTAERPLILAGGGVNISGARDELLAFAEKMNVPVVTTIMGKGCMPANHRLYIGNCGMHGCFAANKAVYNCDVLFSIGTRFNDRITGDLSEFAPNAKIIHVDIASASISRNVIVDVPVVADAKEALLKITEWAVPCNTGSWTAKIDEWNCVNPLGGKPFGMNPESIMKTINSVFNDATYVTDVGQHQMWATQYIKLGKGQKMITSGGLGTMGFGFPAALGAAIGDDSTPVVCITGDGGFQMNMQEMAMACVEHVPVTVCLMNNSYLGMVRQIQHLFYGKRYSTTLLKEDTNPDTPYFPDFVKWGEAYGIHAVRVTKAEEIEPALKEARANNKGINLIEFIIPSDELVLPMVKSGNPMTEMILK